MRHRSRSVRLSRAPVAARLYVSISFLALLTWMLVAGGCSPAIPPESPGGNLLEGLKPIKVDGVRRAEVLTDGVMARTGDSWNTELTAVFRYESAFVEFDLGASKPLRAGYLQADNNDTYTVAASEDGVSFSPFWNAPPRTGLGLQERVAQDLRGNGRYVRVSVAGGDHAYSLSELQLFSQVPQVFPPKLPMQSGLEVAERVRSQILLFGFALALLLASTYRGSSIFIRAAALAFALLMGVKLAIALDAGWPVEQREVSLVRATAAALAAFVVFAEVLVPPRVRPSTRAAVAVLAISAAASIASFFNLGYPQFRDHRTDEPCFVHNFDMRVYYPVAKYFKELRFDGLYLGSVGAYVDDAGVSMASLAKVELRDLKTHRMTRVAEVEDQIRAVKQRFSPERWESFKLDMRYFRQQMGIDDYLGSMSDHGGNATPVWIAIAKLLYAHTTASNAVLLAGAVLDPLLLLIMFAMIGRTFGVRTMLVSAIMFGANDFYMFGTDWAGATLRHDWLAYLGIGICLLRREKWMAGGALVAMSAMIRAFPALALVSVAIPFGYFAWEHWRAHRRLPRWTEIGPSHPLVRTAAGAALCLFSAWLLSSLFLSFDAWIAWLNKVSILDRDPHVNDVSLRGLIAGSLGNQRRVLEARLPLFVAAVAGFVIAIVAAAKGKRYDQAAALGTILIPVVFNPANYYIHFICVLPLLAVEIKRTKAAGDAAGGAPLSGSDAMSWIIILLMCTTQYWTVLTRDLDLHFQSATAIFFFAMTALLANIIHARHEQQPALAGAPSGDSTASTEAATAGTLSAAATALLAGELDAAAVSEGRSHAAS